MTTSLDWLRLNYSSKKMGEITMLQQYQNSTGLQQEKGKQENFWENI